MKIFGKEFKTRKELKADIEWLASEVIEARCDCEVAKYKLDAMRETFPFTLGQTVYDVQLRNENGRYTRKNASLEHSLINEVVVDEKNYFGLVSRYKKNDVFFSYESAREYLESVCVSKSETYSAASSSGEQSTSTNINSEWNKYRTYTEG